MKLIQASVEYIFDFMKYSMNGLLVRSVGLIIAAGIIGLMNLTYSFFRFKQVIRLNLL